MFSVFFVGGVPKWLRERSAKPRFLGSNPSAALKSRIKFMKSFLETSFKKLVLENPVIIASGVCGFGEENKEVLNKVGAVVFKTVTLNPRKGNPPVRVVDLQYGILNSIGLENPGVDGIKEKLEDIKKIKTKKIASFLAETEEEFGIVLDKLESYNVFDGYEINLSCPNVKKGRWFYDKKILKKVLIGLRKKTQKFLSAKISPEGDVFGVVKVIKDAQIDAVVVANTYTALAVDYKTKSFKLGNIYGGYSGAAIKPLTLRLVYDIKKNFDIDIIASGGVIKEEDVIEYVLVGAKAVQIGSGYFRDPQLPVKCIEFFKKYLKENKTFLEQLVGALLVR